MSEDNQLKSQHSDEPAYAAFVNRTDRRVDVIWIDFKGHHVKYCTLTRYNDTFPIQTFVSHPWIFKDADSGDRLVMQENKTVFFPKPLDGNEENLDVVLIGIPGTVKHFIFRESKFSQIRNFPCYTVGKQNYFTGYGILLHKLPVCGCTFQYLQFAHIQ